MILKKTVGSVQIQLKFKSWRLQAKGRHRGGLNFEFVFFTLPTTLVDHAFCLKYLIHIFPHNLSIPAKRCWCKTFFAYLYLCLSSLKDPPLYMNIHNSGWRSWGISLRLVLSNSLFRGRKMCHNERYICTMQIMIWMNDRRCESLQAAAQWANLYCGHKKSWDSDDASFQRVSRNITTF